MYVDKKFIIDYRLAHNISKSDTSGDQIKVPFTVQATFLWAYRFIEHYTCINITHVEVGMAVLLLHY